MTVGLLATKAGETVPHRPVPTAAAVARVRQVALHLALHLAHGLLQENLGPCGLACSVHSAVLCLVYCCRACRMTGRVYRELS